jgi:hypothetical protein
MPRLPGGLAERAHRRPDQSLKRPSATLLADFWETVGAVFRERGISRDDAESQFHYFFFVQKPRSPRPGLSLRRSHAAGRMLAST